MSKIFTIGHSVHTIEEFIELLEIASVTAIADVRSTPYSRHQSQFNRDPLKASLKKEGFEYAFLGKELGARSSDSSCYENGRIQYPRLAKTAIFKSGVDRVIKGSKEHRIALMCSEKEPLDCHRTLLVSRALEARHVNVSHIHADGHVETHGEAMLRLLRIVGLPEIELFRTRDEIVNEACDIHAQKTAWVDPNML